MSDRNTRLGPPYIPPEKSTLKKLRERHHIIAQLLARGLTPSQIARKVGVSPHTINRLKQDPLFQQLADRYREEITYNFTNLMERLRNAVILYLERKLHEGELDGRTLVHLLDSLADRTGFPAVRDVRSVSIGLTRDDLEHLKRITAEVDPETTTILDSIYDDTPHPELSDPTKDLPPDLPSEDPPTKRKRRNTT